MELPLDFEKLREFDLLILIDPNPRDLTAARIEGLKQYLTREGGGLVLVCGEAYTKALFAGESTDSGEDLAGFLDILPVVPSADDSEHARSDGGYAKEWQLRVAESSANHPVLALAKPDEGDRDIAELVATLPGFYWFYPVASAKPLAQPLLLRYDPEEQRVPQKTDSADPVVAAFRFFGSGRVFFLASDSTYLWRSTSEQEYQEFWVNACRYLMQGRLQAGQKRAMLTLTGENLVSDERGSRLPLGGKIDLTVLAYEANLVALLDRSEVEVELEHSESGEIWRVALPRISPTRAGEFTTVFEPPRAGAYVLTILGFAGEEAPPRLLDVTPPAAEQDMPIVNLQLLQEMVDSNRKSQIIAARKARGEEIPKDQTTIDPSGPEGIGALVETASALKKIPGDAPSKRKEYPIFGKRQEVWSSPAAIFLFVLAVGLEWWIRKRSNLV